MDEAEVVILLEIVVSQLPVGINFVNVFVEGGCVRGGCLFQTIGERAQIFTQTFLGVEADEYKAAANVYGDLPQGQGVLGRIKALKVGCG